MPPRVTRKEIYRLRKFRNPLPPGSKWAPLEPSSRSQLPPEEIAKEYAAKVLLSERKFREYSPRTQDFLVDVDSLPLWQRRTLATTFAQAAELYRKADKLDYAEKFDMRAAEYELKGEKGLARRASAAVAIISLVGALTTISMTATGNAIGQSLENNSWVSIGLFLLGCAFAFVYFRMRSGNFEKNSGRDKKRKRR